jgi:hypothetical protein
MLFTLFHVPLLWPSHNMSPYAASSTIALSFKCVVRKTAYSWPSNYADGQIANVVATFAIHAVDDGVAVSLFGKVALNGLVGAVCIADQDREALLNHGVDPTLHFRVEARQAARPSDEDLCDVRVRVLVMASM